MGVYVADVKWKMKRFFRWLLEQDRRRYAAVEAAKLGHSGVDILRRSWSVIRKPFIKAWVIWRKPRIRRRGASEKKGGGRPQRMVAQPTLEANLCPLLQEFTADDRMREGGLWTNPVVARVVTTTVGAGHTRQSPHDPTAAAQTETGPPYGAEDKDDGSPPRPQAPFANIARLRRDYEATGDAVMSSGTNKKEFLGNFHWTGTVFTAETADTFDHDFGSAGQGKLMPHEVYDMVNHHAHIHRNTSHNTSALCCDSVEL